MEEINSCVDIEMQYTKLIRKQIFCRYVMRLELLIKICYRLVQKQIVQLVWLVDFTTDIYRQISTVCNSSAETDVRQVGHIPSFLELPKQLYPGVQLHDTGAR
jgi:hypothetical protein